MTAPVSDYGQPIGINVWSYDFVHHATHDGRTMRLLTLIDEFSRESLAIEARQRFSGAEVIEVLSDVMLIQGIPEHIRSDNGPEMTSRRVLEWLQQIGVERPLRIELTRRPELRTSRGVSLCGTVPDLLVYAGSEYGQLAATRRGAHGSDRPQDQ